MVSPEERFFVSASEVVCTQMASVSIEHKGFAGRDRSSAVRTDLRLALSRTPQSAQKVFGMPLCFAAGMRKTLRLLADERQMIKRSVTALRMWTSTE
jgi:hypothetical protein